MASLRPSEYNQRQRSDGGPFLLIAPSSIDDGSLDVYFTDVEPTQFKPDSLGAKLLNVHPEHLTIWPLNVRPEKDGYLQPKYGSLEYIIVSRKKDIPYQLPENTEDVEALLEGLPDGFAKNFRFGLGLLWEYRQICEAIASIDGIVGLIIHNGREATIKLPHFILGELRFHSLRRGVNRLTARFQRDARKEKHFAIYHDLLHKAAPNQFPQLKKKLRPDTIAEITDGGIHHAKLSKRDQKAVMRMVQDNVEDLAKTEPKNLFSLKSEIELVTLNLLISKFEEMLDKDHPEGKWQVFFSENPFILNLVFAIPTFVVQEQAYVGGKRLAGNGSKFSDFLCAAASTGNLTLIEIKRPNTELLSKRPYRGDDVYTPSTDLTGAIAQVLDQRFKLQNSLPILKDQMNRSDIHSYAVRCIVIAGKTPSEYAQKKSFELFRNNLNGIIVLTFDELLLRLVEIKNILQPTTTELNVPF